MKTFEVNFDGIVGPTHNYSGLSWGNTASIKYKSQTSNPREAALQGLSKMKFMADMGIMQAVLPPHERPHLPSLKALGFQGSDAQIIQRAAMDSPDILYACYSSAAMWTANCATVSPSIDTIDKHLHLTPANLSSKFHRAIESQFTELILKKIFNDPIYFTHHPALPPGNYFADEGAANHNRFCKTYGEPGIQLFIFGRYAFKESALYPVNFPARQTYEASQAIARLHRLYPEKVIVAQQSPFAIDGGAFHNDVVAVANCNLLFFHEEAFVGTNALLEEIKRKVADQCDTEMQFMKVSEKQVPLSDAVNSYLFNSQIVSLPDGKMAMIAPAECEEIESVQRYLKEALQSSENPIARIHYLNLRQSMQNGGGPACLRIRIVLNENEIHAMKKEVLLNDRLYEKLTTWVKKHYRDKLNRSDLQDPELMKESQTALHELTKILELGSIYSFQKN